MALLRSRIKPATADQARPLQRRVTWSDILRPLQATDVRERVLTAYKAAGFGPATFFRPAARAAMADALTRCEDWLEVEHPKRTVERGAIAAVRRVLESEIR
jgi:hypothetical protein